MKIYEDRVVVLVTQHKKEDVIQPIFELETGCVFMTERKYNTDKLGTFSREIKRPKSQLDTARVKIKKGLKMKQAEIGLASEGSFGMHPIAPVPWNVELVLLYDKKENHEIYGVYESSETNFSHIKTDDYKAVLTFAEKIGFPEHYLIIRPDHENAGGVMKDIDSFDKLEKAFMKCSKLSKTGEVFLETDMRAHANPTRMKNIRKATENLVSKLLSLCPSCGAPGFVITEMVRGLPCEWCGTPSEMILKHVYSCHKCKHEEERLYPNGQSAHPRYCAFCNP